MTFYSKSNRVGQRMFVVCHKCWPTFFIGQLMLAKFERVLFLLATFPELL